MKRFSTLSACSGLFAILLLPSQLLAQTPSSPAAAVSSQAVGVLRVKTDVTEAQVVLDDQEVGVTPLTLRSVTEGKHRLVILKDGFEDHTQEVEVTQAKPTSVFVVMKPSRLEMPELPQTFNVIHQHRLGSCHGKLTVTAEALDYQAENDSDKFHIPIASLTSVSRSWGPTAGTFAFGIRAPTDAMAFRITTSGRSYGFLAFQDSPEDKMAIASVKTKELHSIVYRLWSLTLKGPKTKQ